MSEETVERVYTINLGKVLLSPNNQRAKRAINMIKEFAIRHMKSETVKMEEDVSHLVWQRGIRHPPRKIRVKLTKDDDGAILISKYQEEKPKKEEVEKKPKTQIEKPVEKVETKLEEPKPAKSEVVTEKESETKKEPKQKQEKPKKETKSKKSEEKTKTKSDSKRKKK